MLRVYAIATSFLLGFLWLVARRFALDTQAHLAHIRDESLDLPRLTRFIYFITPQAWIIPLALLLAVALLWKKDEKWTAQALGLATVVFLLYLCLCAVGLAIPFFPKLD